MPFSDRTIDFKEATKAKQNALPSSKKQKGHQSTAAQRQNQPAMGKEYISEAYVIVRTS
jgi:hypothetical protein